MNKKFWQWSGIFTILTLIFLGILTKPVFAHHLLSGKLPINGFQGFMSGLAHPIIGVDHFAFVVAVGLLTSIYSKSSLILPLTFILATLAGTGLHLMSFNLPLAEIVIATSVICGGLLLTVTCSLNPLGLMIGAAIAGLFHGYAYGEAIMGAQMLPLWSYLLGFTVIQGIIVTLAYRFGKVMLSSLTFRWVGFTIAGMGLAFLATAISG